MLNKVQNIKEYYLTECSIVLKSDGIVYVKLLKDQVIDIPLQTRMAEVYKTITNGKFAPYLFEGEDGVVFTKDARENALTMDGLLPINAVAVIVTNTAESLVANFYLKFNKPKHPYKVFKIAMRQFPGYLNTFKLLHTYSLQITKRI